MSEQRETDQPADPAENLAGGRSGTPGDSAAGHPGVTTIDVDDSAPDLETAMREALAAVEAVEGGTPANAANPSNPSNPAAPSESEVTTLRREAAELRDRSIRTLADFDNFRKRAERERQDTRRYALLEPLREFLPIADNLDRALSAGGSADDLKRGVEMILRQMQELLRRFGAREVPAAGEVFNPAVHEAVARTESAAVSVPTVTEEMVRGYMLHDRLLRPAMVKVAVPPEGAGAAAPSRAGAGAAGDDESVPPAGASSPDGRS